MATEAAVAQATDDGFMDKVIGDFSGTMSTVMCMFGDRLGLFDALTSGGPATSAALAERAHLSERYVREWLNQLASAGYLTYDPAGQTFTLPPEHAALLGALGGSYQWLASTLPIFDRFVEAFRTGKGIAPATLPKDTWAGLERYSCAMSFEHNLLGEWLPALPHIRAKLEAGITVADIGCGHGQALIKLAEAFPNSRYVGYDALAATVAQATANAENAGVADRVRFVQRDGADGLPEQYDLITTFDVVHDVARPLDLLRAIRRGLRDDGTYLCLEADSAERLEENAGTIGAMQYGVSILHCMTVSLGAGGPGLGTCGLPEPKMRALCAEAGFGSVARAPVNAPFEVLYEIKP